MRIHILGISGTFMAGIAILAKQLGHRVTGSDKSFFEPMKSVLLRAKIKVTENYNPKNLNEKIDGLLLTLYRLRHKCWRKVADGGLPQHYRLV